MMVPLDSEEEAGYLLAILSSSTVNLAVDAYAIATSTNTQVLEIVKVERYNEKNNYMKKLSDDGTKTFQKSSLDNNLVDDMVVNLFGITNEEMNDIRRNLA